MRFDPNATELAGVPQETLRLYLAQAQIAYNNLMIGGQPVSVSYEGKSVTYRVADAGGLAQYIMYLQRMLGNCSARRRALRPFFR
jgi:hypothetical protein